MSLDFGYKQTGRSRTKAAKDKDQDRFVEPAKLDTKAVAWAGIEATVGEARKAADRKWGRNRLEKIVSSEMAGKFASAWARYSLARRGGNLAELEQRADVVKRGFAAMDRAAAESGCQPIPPPFWQITDEVGKKFLFVRDNEDITQLSDEITKDCAVWHLGEVIKVMKFAGLDWANEVKREFGKDTELTRIGKPGSIEMMDDDIPF